MRSRRHLPYSSWRIAQSRNSAPLNLDLTHFFPQCHLLHADAETITLHLSTHTSPSATGDLESHPTLQPYGITYRPHTNVSGSGCPEDAKGMKVPFTWDGNSRDVEVVLKTKDLLPRYVFLSRSRCLADGYFVAHV